MKKEKRNILMIVFIIAIILAISTVSYAYAVRTSTLKINGQGNVDASVWNVKFQNLSSPTIIGNTVINTAPILSDTTIGTFDVSFKKPDDLLSYNFYIVNNGDIDAKIGTFTKDIVTCTGSGTNQVIDETLVCDNLIYTFKYTGTNLDVATGDLLRSGDSKQVTLTLKYIGSSLPTNSVEITGLGITIIYIQD